MEPLVRIERRIASLHDLLSVVTAMRSLAGMRVREARQTLLGVQHYLAAVQRALAAAVPLLPPEGAAPPRSEGPTAVFVFGSEHGFVGALNDRLVEMALRHARGHEDSRLFVVGSRGARIVLERRVEPAWTQAMATRTGSIIDVARRLADQLYLSVDAGKFSRVVLVYAASEAGSGWEARSSLLLPFDPSPYRPRQGAGLPPLHYLPPERLIEKLIEELVFAELLRAALESFASENAARLATMQSAHQAIEEKLRDLQRDANVQRQEEITTELLDIVTGAEALQEPL